MIDSSFFLFLWRFFFIYICSTSFSVFFISFFLVSPFTSSFVFFFIIAIYLLFSRIWIFFRRVFFSFHIFCLNITAFWSSCWLTFCWFLRFFCFLWFFFGTLILLFLWFLYFISSRYTFKSLIRIVRFCIWISLTYMVNLILIVFLLNCWIMRTSSLSWCTTFVITKAATSCWTIAILRITPHVFVTNTVWRLQLDVTLGLWLPKIVFWWNIWRSIVTLMLLFSIHIVARSLRWTSSVPLEWRCYWRVYLRT